MTDNVITALHRGFMKQDNGWVTPFNGYQYKLTEHTQSWQDSRRICQRLGGDLIVYGFRDVAVGE